MLTDPVKFYEYFQIAHNQLKKMPSAKSTKEEKKEESKEEVSGVNRLNEYDDMSLFLLTMPAHLIEGREEQL